MEGEGVPHSHSHHTKLTHPCIYVLVVLVLVEGIVVGTRECGAQSQLISTTLIKCMLHWGKKTSAKLNAWTTFFIEYSISILIPPSDAINNANRVFFFFFFDHSDFLFLFSDYISKKKSSNVWRRSTDIFLG